MLLKPRGFYWGHRRAIVPKVRLATLVTAWSELNLLAALALLSFITGGPTGWAQTVPPNATQSGERTRVPVFPQKPKDAKPDTRKKKFPSLREELKLPVIPRTFPKPSSPKRPSFPLSPKPFQPERTLVPGLPGPPPPPQPEPKKELEDLLIKKGFEGNFPSIPPSNTGHSFRIATFNTHLISPIFNKEIFDSEHADADAHNIANAIANESNTLHSFDVIVLNEVWDEHAKKILVDTLSQIFPYYIMKMDGPDDLTIDNSGAPLVTAPDIEDSGLMLFSKLPFDNFKIGTPSKMVDRAFHKFRSSSGVDAFANKGIGAVVLYHAQANSHYLVGFTHLQDEDPQVRVSQMEENRNFISHLRSLNPETRRSETFVLGDLNIQGVNLLEKFDPNWKAADEKEQEWADQFLNQQSYFLYPLYDAWAWTTSPTDLGFTNPGGNQRLDYIIHERETGAGTPYAVQHMHHVMVGRTDSDHVAVAADLNLPSLANVPRLALRPELNKSKPNGWWDCMPFEDNPNHDVLLGQLQYPGSMQWYRFDSAGTYSIGISQKLADAGLDVTVFQANDLSTPIVVYNKEYTTVYLGKDPPLPFNLEKYHIGSPPFYVRVSNPTDRTWHGNYNIALHRHRGANMTDAITLHPGEKSINPEMPVGKPLNAEDTVWFKFITDKAHSNLPQDLEIMVENNSGKKVSLTLLEADPNDPNNTIQEKATGKADQPNLTQSEIGGKIHYLNVAGSDVDQQDFGVGWRTNLTWLVGMGLPGITWPFKLVCTDETDSDWAGSDEIVFNIFVDGTLYSSESFDDVDTGNHFSYEGLIQPVAFLKSVETTISEIGAVDSPDVDVAKILPLDPSTSLELRKWVDLFPDDGNYEFRFNLSHWLNK